MYLLLMFTTYPEHSLLGLETQEQEPALQLKRLKPRPLHQHPAVRPRWAELMTSKEDELLKCTSPPVMDNGTHKQSLQFVQQTYNKWQLQSMRQI